MSKLFHQPDTGVWWKDHSLTIVLTLIILATALFSIYAGNYVWQHEQPLETSQPWVWGFWVWWFWEYSVALTAEVTAIAILVIITKKFREKGSAESN